MMEPICATCGAEVGWDADECSWCALVDRMRKGHRRPSDEVLAERKHKRVPDLRSEGPS